MSVKHLTWIVVLGCAVFIAGTAAAQHRWKTAPQLPSKTSGRAEPIRAPSIVAPRAAIGSGSNGIYCPDMSEDAVGVHDLGWIPSGFKVEVIVESYSESAFDPVAGVLTATLGEKAGNTVKTVTFYDNDSGGDRDSKVSFTTSQAGTYLLVVTDYTGKTGGCYRYQANISR